MSTIPFGGPEPQTTFTCLDECGTKATLPVTTPGPPGWQMMEMRKGWRCPACIKALAAVNQPKERQ